jgi:ABC-type transport system substrate-binding protein
VQNPDYKSPLRANYLGVEIEKIDDLTVRFKLTTAYGGFLERLTLKIMPAHIWQNISPQNFLLTSYNLKPVGSGPYKFKKLKQDSFNTITSLELVRFANYFDSPQPYLAKIVFRFYQNEEELVAAAKRGEVDGFAISNPDYWKYFQARLSEYSLSLPRYFAVFFNPDKSRFLAKAEIRQALNYATDKEEIVASAILGQAEIIDSPLLPEIYGLEVPSTTYTFNPTKAEELITKTGLKKQDGQWVEINTTGVVEFKSDLKLGSTGQEVTALQTCLAKDSAVYPSGKVTGYFGSDTKAAVIKFQEKYAADILTPQGFDEGTGLVAKGTRTKLNEICFKDQKQTELSFTLITVKDPILEKVAELLKTQWESLGIGIEIKTYSISQLETEIIKPRNYEMLLFGEALTAIPDPYPFWHSSQKSDPGLNLAKYVNTKADKLLETARITMDEALRNQKYQDLQNIIIADAPALFLYSPDYIYFVSQKIKGLATELIVDPSKRFANIGAWHIKTHRSW